ncbi:thioredoxin [Atopococcus tabaci]|uniref:thioredoxin n=1 Tax=Atopococcus tabaci TaxID=269774 RepID=UPI0004095CF9|nr:thioredoxin [Atopococcus tabaci]
MTVQVTDATLMNEVKDGLTLVDFWAPWCGPCRMIAPILEQLDEEMGEEVKIAKLNIDENEATAAEFGIQSIPTMILFKDGQPMEKIIGAHPKEVLKDYLEKKIAEK